MRDGDDGDFGIKEGGISLVEQALQGGARCQAAMELSLRDAQR